MRQGLSTRHLLAIRDLTQLGMHFEVDGQSILVRGKVDRVDRHPAHGWRVLDYKTGERSTTPARVHGPPHPAVR